MSVRNQFLVFFFVLFVGGSLQSQVRISSESELELLRDTPMEAMYVHGNGNLFFPGEYLYYSMYCINTQTYRLSKLSKLAYVQLIGENGRVAFTQKIPLESGKGQGDYFFPTDLPSGNYKLVAYTHWMKNAGVEQFFMSDLTFINPYRSDQNVFLNVGDDHDTCAGVVDTTQTLEVASSNEIIGLELDRMSYSPGEEATLRVENYRGNRGAGTYSLSVRVADGLPHSPPVTSERFALRYPGLLKQIPQRVNDVLSIPEQRGELISGQVTIGEEARPLPGRLVAISLPAEDFQVKQVQTDDEGKFYTYVTRPFPGSYGIAELLSQEESKIVFNWAETHSWEEEIPCFELFRLDASMEEQIRRRSIHNQIENSYFEVKPDTLMEVETVDPFEGDVPLIFDLDTYNRFRTLRETFVEVVNYVMVRRVNSDTDTFKVLPPQGEEDDIDDLDPPLVVVDGILVPDHNALLDYDARKIKMIKVLREQYQIAGDTYQGMVAIQTIDGIYAQEWASDSGDRFSYLTPIPRKRYYRQSANTAHIPDYRGQLLWEPDIELETEGKSFTFYTSQVPGSYEIVLEGYTSYGKPVSLKSTITVVNAQ